MQEPSTFWAALSRKKGELHISSEERGFKGLPWSCRAPRSLGMTTGRDGWARVETSELPTLTINTHPSSCVRAFLGRTDASPRHPHNIRPNLALPVTLTLALYILISLSLHFCGHSSRQTHTLTRRIHGDILPSLSKCETFMGLMETTAEEVRISRNKSILSKKLPYIISLSITSSNNSFKHL